jgi:hypothetical protein
MEHADNPYAFLWMSTKEPCTKRANRFKGITFSAFGNNHRSACRFTQAFTTE